MKANELRIGNFLIELGNDPDPLRRIFNVTAIYGRNTERFVVEDDNGDIMNSSFLTGIPLTEEWLLKFGFKKERKSYLKGVHQELFSGLMELTFDRLLQKWVFSVGKYKDITRLQYVHQLQNLYFALTGEELEIK
jgi:hypothetical protein